MRVQRGTPRSVINRFSEEAIRAVKSPDVDYLVRDGGEPVGSAIDAATAHFPREAEKYARIVTVGNLRAD